MNRGCVNCGGEADDEHAVVLGEGERLDLWLCAGCRDALAAHDAIEVE